jgi:hypothetical protein
MMLRKVVFCVNLEFGPEFPDDKNRHSAEAVPASVVGEVVLNEGDATCMFYRRISDPVMPALRDYPKVFERSIAGPYESEHY